MAERAVSPRLLDIIEAAEHIRSALEGIPLEAFEQDWQKRWLIERGVEIISESSRHLSMEIKARRSEIPWSKVAGIGNILRHDYERVAPDLLGSWYGTICRFLRKCAARNWPPRPIVRARNRQTAAAGNFLKGA